MKQFKQLLQIEPQIPTRTTRTLSFQALSKPNHRYAQNPNINQKLQKLAQKEPKKHPQPLIPNTSRDRIQPTITLKRLPKPQPQTDKIQGVPIITSMTASQEKDDIPVRLNTEEREEIVEKMEEIKEDLIKEIMWNKRKFSLDPNGTLRSIKRELDARTDRLYDDVMAKRNNRQVYIKAREELRVFFSKKKEQKPIRQKTLGTPCFQQASNTKHSNTKQSSNSQNNTIESQKALPSTGHKLTVRKKSSIGSTKAIKDMIMARCQKQEEVNIQEFRLQ